MAAIKAFILRWMARTLRLSIPKTPWGDRLYSRLHVLYMQKRLPRYRHPQTFSDYLFRLRAGPEADDLFRQRIADKLLVKDYISEAAGPQYAVETLAVLESDDDVDAFEPSKIPCVIKPTHASGRVILLRRDGDEIDKDSMKSWLRLNYYDIHRERTYRNIKKRIIVEDMLSDDGITLPDDYKVFCFHGEPKFIQVVTGRCSTLTRNLYTLDWQALPFTFKYPRGAEIPRPVFLEEMLRVSRRLAAPLWFIRVDFLYAKGRLKVGELTNIPDGANSMFRPVSVDLKLARLFTDPKVTVEQALEGLI